MISSATPARGDGRVAPQADDGVADLRAVAGGGWWAVYRFGRKLVSVRVAVGAEKAGPTMPVLTTLAHALLQIVTVALGSPLGREVAPREIGALLAQKLTRLGGLDAAETRMIVACGAGGGLAAVYNVPLAGALFVLEALLVTFSPKPVILAVAVSVIASITAWIGLGNVAQYSVPDYAISASLVGWAIVAGPLFGVAAYFFRRMTAACIGQAVTGWQRIPWSLAVFGVIGLCAGLFPQLPGNGRGPIQLGFDGQLGLTLAAELLLLKLLGIAGALRAGAAGGVLTPGMTVGALLAILLGAAWNLVFAAQPAGAYAIVGSAAFLASSMNMPLTAIALALEFTRVGHDFLVPVSLAVAGSAGTHRLCLQFEKAKR